MRVHIKSTRGFLTIVVLTVSTVFLFLLAELMGSLTLERTAENLSLDNEGAFHMAEAGLEYYRWHLAEFPSDVEDGTGSAGPYVHAVTDPESTATAAGSFSLSISGVTSCGVLTSATVRSTGWLTTTPTHTRTLIGKYGTPTFAASTSPAKSDATKIASSFSNLKTYAQNSGVYLPPSGVGNYGYKVVFNSNGTFDVYPVTGVTAVWGYSTEDGWQQENTIIASTGIGVNHTIPAGCPVIFVEDNVWLQGTVSGKATLVAADITTAGVAPSIILTGNITYAHAYDDGFTAVAEKSVLISLDSPDVLQLSGVYVAASGHFGRHRYDASGTHAVPTGLQSEVTRSTLQTVGTFASNGSSNTKWTSGGVFISGYSIETDTHDPLLGEVPPPFTPTTADAFSFSDWRTAD